MCFEYVGSTGCADISPKSRIQISLSFKGLLSVGVSVCIFGSSHEKVAVLPNYGKFLSQFHMWLILGPDHSSLVSRIIKYHNWEVFGCSLLNDACHWSCGVSRLTDRWLHRLTVTDYMAASHQVNTWKRMKSAAKKRVVKIYNRPKMERLLSRQTPFSVRRVARATLQGHML